MGGILRNRGGRVLLLLAVATMLPAVVLAAGVSESFSRTSLTLILMITLADASGYLFERLGMPELVGEICAGILLGNLALLGIDFNFSALLRSSDFMSYAAELALVLLLFLVGLESDMRDLLKVGRNAAAVACAGVLLPVALGLGAAVLLGMNGGMQGWFVGATLAATSVGITARLLIAQNKLKSASGEVILGAAVIDDILGILLLAVLASVAASGEFAWATLLLIVAKALLFFAAAVLIGQRLMPEIVHMVSVTKHASIWTGFAFCLALAFAELASQAGLAPLIGAFVAGLLLDDVNFRVGDTLQKHTLEELIRPITDIFICIFFVYIGAQVQLQVLTDPAILLAIVVLTLVAVVSKAAAGYLVTGPGFDRLGVGLGMVPRGEVGLVFASFAFAHGIFTPTVYATLVMVVLLTTVIGPALLKPRLVRF
ncbi:cation:proton antiporter [Seongchinamella sediminis]|uniref:Cation:proton antiporter n=1 Tax=Seongchinamella sediminis TaxID=2283635 RepID=A0A3L7E428_9GAMM|nr:cation:proton antiporter [Seongchinamella sediminis]RLQ23590.1 cation:proton antiporter [Seongchinamella sediminis]